MSPSRQLLKTQPKRSQNATQRNAGPKGNEIEGEVKDTSREPVNSMIYTKKVTHVWPSTDFPKRTSKTQVLQETCFSGTLKTQRQNAFVFKGGRSNVMFKPRTHIQNAQNARNNSDCRQNAVRTHDPKRKFCKFPKTRVLQNAVLQNAVLSSRTRF